MAETRIDEAHRLQDTEPIRFDPRLNDLAVPNGVDADPLVAAATTAIVTRGGALCIRTLARELGTSQDPLEKRVRRAIGASPKKVASIVRFLRVVRGFEGGKPLTELAHEAGYYDQPHLVHDFRAFTGEAPERFLRAGEHC